MSNERVYLSTTIPYVNAPPHLGFALELVQADVLARHHRLAGDEVTEAMQRVAEMHAEYARLSGMP